MKLITYNSLNAAKRVITNPTVCFHYKGLVTFSKKAKEVLGIKEGDKIEILQDEESLEDWYIHKSENQNAFTVRGKSGKREQTACISSAVVTNKIFNLLGVASNTRSVVCKIGNEPVEYNDLLLFPIITKSAKIKSRI